MCGLKPFWKTAGERPRKQKIVDCYHARLWVLVSSMTDVTLITINSNSVNNHSKESLVAIYVFFVFNVLISKQEILAV